MLRTPFFSQMSEHSYDSDNYEPSGDDRASDDDDFDEENEVIGHAV